MSDRQHNGQEPTIDLAALTDDQREGRTCVNCGTSGGQMRPIATPDNPHSAVVVLHADSLVCLRRVAGYVADLHMRMVHISEYAADTLARAAGTGEP